MQAVELNVDTRVSLPRLVVVSRLPAPYREPLFQRIAEDGRIGLWVLYQFKVREGTAWGLDYDENSNLYKYTKEFSGDTPSGLGQALNSFIQTFKRLKELEPDLVLIHGYSYTNSWAAILYCRLNQKKYGLRSDSNANIDRRKGIRGFVKKLYLEWLVNKANAIFYIGTANRINWEYYGGTNEQLVEARYAVDDRNFSPASEPKGSDTPVRFLYVGRLVPRKNVLKLVRAFQQLNLGDHQATLTVVGTGPQESDLLELLRSVGKSSIDFTGRRTPSELPAIYREHDVLVCPYEHEPWGLAINEAISCGLAIVAATNGTCGAAVDLVIDGDNGIGLDEVSEESLTVALRRLGENPADVKRMKKSSARLTVDWTYDWAVSSLISETLKAGQNL